MNGYLIVGIVVVAVIVLLLATNKKLIETLKNIYKIEELRQAYTLYAWAPVGIPSGLFCGDTGYQPQCFGRRFGFG